MDGIQLRRLRLQAELTQAQLAEKAGVSRALVSAVEAGRHLPRIDAALALATALGTTAEALFGRAVGAPVDALTGEPPAAGTPVRAGTVGDQIVTAAPRPPSEGWEIVDGIAGALESEAVLRSGPYVVLAGCEPGLVLLERLLREHGTPALAIAASSAVAAAALAAGRLHAAAIHFPTGSPPAREDSGVRRIHLARWRVGLASAPGAKRRWWSGALAGREPVIQCGPGAAAQKAFERAATHTRADQTNGPRVGGPLEAARLCLASGLPAVTIEPAAAAAGAVFHPLETHDVELWIAAERAAEAGVARLLNELAGRPYRRTLASLGAYDLEGAGDLVA